MKQLSFKAHQTLEVLEKPISSPNWWRVRKKKNEIGFVPKNRLKVVNEYYAETLFDFIGQNNLSFRKGEVLEVIERPVGGKTEGWWKCTRKVQKSGSSSIEIGNISSSHLQILGNFTVRGLYKYKGFNELSVKIGDTLEILKSKPNQVKENWSRARLVNTTEIGYIPNHYIRSKFDDHSENENDADFSKENFLKNQKDKNIIDLATANTNVLGEKKLSFRKDQKLLIFDVLPNKNGWWMAQTLKSKRIGMVPVNFVKFF